MVSAPAAHGQGSHSAASPHMRRMQLGLMLALLALLVLSLPAAAGAAYVLAVLQEHASAWLLVATLATAVALAEAVFAFAWVAKYKRLNAQPQPIHAPSHEGFHPRQAFDRFVHQQYNLHKYICIQAMLSQWFHAPIEEIYSENVEELITYGFWYMSRDEYQAAHGTSPHLLVEELERAWGLNFPRGHNTKLSFMAHLLQPLRCDYRPLAFYLSIEALFGLKHVLLLAMGFKADSHAGYTFYTFNAQLAGTTEVPPICFLHGVGLGLLPYITFVMRLAATGAPLVAVECSHLGMRWVAHVPSADEVAEVVEQVLTQRLGWSKLCLAAHSYGTFFASRLLQVHPELVDSLLLVDPVTFNIFTGLLVKNFVYTPRISSPVTWFIARDIHHAASVCRNFYWSSLNLWPELLPARTLVVLSAEDKLVPVEETLLMLQHQAPHALVMHHPTHKHADFLHDFVWQDKVVDSLWRMINLPAPVLIKASTTVVADELVVIAPSVFVLALAAAPTGPAISSTTITMLTGRDSTSVDRSTGTITVVKQQGAAFTVDVSAVSGQAACGKLQPHQRHMPRGTVEPQHGCSDSVNSVEMSGNTALPRLRPKPHRMMRDDAR